MQLRTLGTLAAGLGLWLGSTHAKEPAKLPLPDMSEKAKTADDKAANQKLADAVADQLKASDAANNADLDVIATAGAVTVTGSVGSDAQKKAILEVIRRVGGVTLVKDGIAVKAMAPVQTVMTAQALGGPFATQAPSAMPPTMMRLNGDAQIDPVPIGPGGGLDGAAPPLPPHAWPTYAPYNNISRVAYPTAYPANAFPFIGPYYPFPKVPLGWRKVTLEWEDGHWWLGRKQAPIDYWRVKFGY